MATLILFTTSGCHLCEQAQRLIQKVWGRSASEIEITDDARLLDDYGTRIPVLRRTDTGIEIAWPFDATDILELLKRDGADQ
ncbi:MAG: glutaredoxin family protein [Gammaproteobacteria bacterium]|nr:glutaredoxin family protein [Gammaproteobacteria bacterium]MCP5425229.1 glutaredoxin family protein [Gammaproteobacteria bacterium]MCP5459617.1 glutaredoxin family protein [Gammaproteobacteria bacterium]